jgi:DNA-binding MarR family transcriptional regulator
MTEIPEHSAPAIRRALNRKALAATRQRGALARLLELTDSEVLAIQHLALAGQLTPGQLAVQLGLSSGGTTALIHRLEDAGHLTRHAHPRDKRSVVLRLSPAIQARVAEAWAPLVEEIDGRVGQLTDDERATVARFLDAVAGAAERHVDLLLNEAAARADDELAVPSPYLWA